MDGVNKKDIAHLIETLRWANSTGSGFRHNSAGSESVVGQWITDRR